MIIASIIIHVSVSARPIAGTNDRGRAGDHRASRRRPAYPANRRRQEALQVAATAKDPTASAAHREETRHHTVTGDHERVQLHHSTGPLTDNQGRSLHKERQGTLHLQFTYVYCASIDGAVRVYRTRT